MPCSIANCFKFTSVITIPKRFKLSVSPVKTELKAFVTSSIFMFLKDAKSPASPTKEVDILAASLVVKPIEVLISPNKAAISKAVPSAIPKLSNVVFAKSLTSPLEFLKDTSTLFKLSWKSEANFIAAPPARVIGAVT